MDARGFNRALQLWVEKDVKGGALKFYKAIVLDLGRSIVLGTPVLTGQARGNWRFTKSRVSGAYNPSARDPSGSGALTRLYGVLASLKLSEPVYMTNNAPYILKLEHGYSKQAPSGMLAKSIYYVESKYRLFR